MTATEPTRGAAAFQAVELKHGWTFKRTDDEPSDAWLPVKAVPSTVHQDLIDNKR